MGMPAKNAKKRRRSRSGNTATSGNAVTERSSDGKGGDGKGSKIGKG